MKEFIKYTDISKEKKLVISLGLLLCSTVLSAVSVFSFYKNINDVALSSFVGAELTAIGGAFYFGGAFWQKGKEFNNENSPLINDNEIELI